MLRGTSTLIAATLGVASIVALGASPAQASTPAIGVTSTEFDPPIASGDPKEFPLVERVLRGGQSASIPAFTCPTNIPYLLDSPLAPGFPTAPKGMQLITSNTLFELTISPALITDIEGRVIGWNDAGLIRNTAGPLEWPETFRVSALCTEDITRSYTG